MEKKALCPEVKKESKPAHSAKEDRNAKAALPDDELELVSAGSSDGVPTEDVDVLLGRHARPDGEDTRRP